MNADGLNNVPYKVISIQSYTFYTKIQIDVFQHYLKTQRDDFTTKNTPEIANKTSTQNVPTMPKDTNKQSRLDKQ
jgi:hypothetical protein